MRSRFRIPNDWSDEDVRDVLGLRYELDLRNYSSLPIYTLLSDVDAAQLAELMELNVPGMQVQASTAPVLTSSTTQAAPSASLPSSLAPTPVCRSFST